MAIENWVAQGVEMTGDMRERVVLDTLVGNVGGDFSFMINIIDDASVSVGNGPSPCLLQRAFDFLRGAIAWGCSIWTTLTPRRLAL